MFGTKLVTTRIGNGSLWRVGSTSFTRKFCVSPEKPSPVNNTPETYTLLEKKSFFKNVFEYGAFSSAAMGGVTLAEVMLIDYFTIVDPSSYTSYSIIGGLFGLTVGCFRGGIIGIGQTFIEGRKLSGVIGYAIEKSGMSHIRLDNASEAEITAMVEKIYARFPWTYQKTILSSVKRTIAFSLLPNVEQVISAIHTEIQFNRVRKKPVGNFEQLVCGVVNGLAQSQIDKVDTISLVLSWIVFGVVSASTFMVVYSTKKSMIWVGEKKDQLMEKVDIKGKQEIIQQKKDAYYDKKQEILDNIKNRKNNDSNDNQEGYIAQKKEKVKDWWDKKKSEKKKDTEKIDNTLNSSNDINEKE